MQNPSVPFSLSPYHNLIPCGLCCLLTCRCVACLVCVCVRGGCQSGLTPLHVAAHYDNQRVALLLLDQGASPHSAAKVSTQTHLSQRSSRPADAFSSVRTVLCV